VLHNALKVLAHLAYRNAAFASAMLALPGVLDVLVAVLNRPEEYLLVFVGLLSLWSGPDQEEVHEEDLLAAAAEALANLAELSSANQAVIAAVLGSSTGLVDLLNSSSIRVQALAVRALANLADGNAANVTQQESHDFLWCWAG